MSSDPGSTGNPLDPRRRPGASTDTPSQQATDGRAVPGQDVGGPDGGGAPGGGPPDQDQADPQGRAIPPAHAGAQSTDPDPGDTPGLEAGGGVAPGDTPPSESGTAVRAVPEVKGPSRAANLAIPLGILLVIVLGGLALLLGRLFGG